MYELDIQVDQETHTPEFTYRRLDKGALDRLGQDRHGASKLSSNTRLSNTSSGTGSGSKDTSRHVSRRYCGMKQKEEDVKR